MLQKRFFVLIFGWIQADGIRSLVLIDILATIEIDTREACEVVIKNGFFVIILTQLRSNFPNSSQMTYTLTEIRIALRHQHSCSLVIWNFFCCWKRHRRWNGTTRWAYSSTLFTWILTCTYQIQTLCWPNVEI